MVSGDIGKNVAQGFLLLANMFNTVTINKLVVPDVVEMGNSSNAVLDCQFSSADNRFALQWLFDREDEPVYEWRPGTPPKVSGILAGRVDPTFKISNSAIDEGRALRIVNLAPELSGEYTCRVLSDDGGDARQTKAMLVFNPEVDFNMTAYHIKGTDTWKLSCSARNLTLLPELSLEFNTVPIPRQIQNGQRDENKLYTVTTSVRVTARDGLAACRLHLPVAGYSAVRTRRLLLSQ
ncbi:hypothetical protein MSG28_006196 [Choristoneura fumiferana]|uniref:Uncharacterized protein n=1 Tax=Choristoneura fumiferana TaxID=7141 RepID=A0ACC0JDZ2_CHOFU|nr:hypothetical protein MSG28_006196 [Choristoneura fumiferana]